MSVRRAGLQNERDLLGMDSRVLDRPEHMERPLSENNISKTSFSAYAMSLFQALDLV
jgi:hypothetical protein